VAQAVEGTPVAHLGVGRCALRNRLRPNPSAMHVAASCSSKPHRRARRSCVSGVLSVLVG